MTNITGVTNDQEVTRQEQTAALAPTDPTHASPFDHNKTVLFDALVASGITQIVVTFDGYGDSGQIEEVTARNGDGIIAIPERMVELFDPASSQSEPRPSGVSIASAVETLAYDVLAQTHCGWENNDGAYGDIVFDVAERTITLDYNERYSTSENFNHIL